MSMFIHRAPGHFLMNEAGGDSGGGALDVNGGAAAFSALLDPPASAGQSESSEEQPESPVEPEAELEVDPDAKTSENEEAPQTFTVKIDGKEVQVPTRRAVERLPTSV
ncbi:hypothetical protein [Pseudomonas sp. BGI-2]|uniref:hypothetical protein n=1 Tax=Pseudomonas sp. BGI-2 TaxID=2528211 RepID=UPI001C49C048|nr:hypothetical protein [Pseudomonas sp. BGI-2]